MNYADVHEINMYLEGNNFAFKIWKQSYEAFNNYFSNFKKLYYSNYIVPIEKRGLSLLESCIELQNIYKKELEKCVSKYDKDKLLVSLFYIKEYITKNMTKLDDSLTYIEDERASINFLIYIVYNLECPNKGSLLTEVNAENNTYLGDIFTYARCHNLLSANMERIEDVPEGKSLINMAFDTVETEYYHGFFDEFEALGESEKIEDYEISDINIKAQVERLGISLNQVKQKSDKCISDMFGFHLDTLEMLLKSIVSLIIKDEAEFHFYIQNDDAVGSVIPIPKKCLFEIADCQNISSHELDSIIKNFSIYQKEERAIELSCFYVNEEKICFGICDLMQTFNMFEKFALSGAHLQYYVKNDKYMQLLHPSQKAMSKYLCFIMADDLMKNGYALPMEKFKYNGKKYTAPRVEMEKIFDKKKNILGDSGDCDVLFLSEYSAQIICVEFKYFVPAITYEELKKSDRNKITKQIYEKKIQIQKRESALKSNIPFLISYLGGTQQNYSVKTIIVLARPNMYMFSDEIKNRIPYEFMTMNQFLKMVDEHKI